jgi:hypothetical protein
MKFVRDLKAKGTSVGDGGRVRPSALCPRFECSFSDLTNAFRHLSAA